MVSKCPKCRKDTPEDALYCPYCAHGLKPEAMTVRVSAAGVLMVASGIASFTLSYLSIVALTQLYNWYPQLVAQSWFTYVQFLTAFSLLELISSISAAILSSIRKKYSLAMISAMLAVFSGAGAWLTSMSVPDYRLLNSLVYYFLPMLVVPLVATALIYPRRKEFRS